MADRVVSFPAGMVQQVADRLCDLDMHLPGDEAEDIARDIVIDVTNAVDKLRAPAEEKGREQFYSDLWWLSQEMDNIADAIGPVPDLAETNLRAQANLLRDVIEPLKPHA